MGKKTWVFIFLLLSKFLIGQSDNSTHFEFNSSDDSLKIKTRAIVIGVSKYPQSSLQPLEFADDDAYLFSKYLSTLNNVSMDILVDSNTSQPPGILFTLDRLIRESKADDRIIFFFAGHGDIQSDYYKDGALMLYDADVSSKYPLGPWTKGIISLKTISSYAQKANEKGVEFILIIDACKAGYIENEFNTNNERIDSGKSCFMFSSEGSQSAYQSSKLKHGVFTYYLCSGLFGEADKDLDKILTLRELERHTEDKLTDFSKMYFNDSYRQTPIFKGYSEFSLPVGNVSLSQEEELISQNLSLIQDDIKSKGFESNEKQYVGFPNLPLISFIDFLFENKLYLPIDTCANCDKISSLKLEPNEQINFSGKVGCSVKENTILLRGLFSLDSISIDLREKIVQTLPSRSEDILFFLTENYLGQIGFKERIPLKLFSFDKCEYRKIVCENGNEILLELNSGELKLYNKQTGELVNFKKLKSKNVKDIIILKKGLIILDKKNSVRIFNYRGEQQFVFRKLWKGELKEIVAFDELNAILISGSGGKLIKLNLNTNQIELETLLTEGIIAIEKDNIGGYIYVLTNESKIIKIDINNLSKLEYQKIKNRDSSSFKFIYGLNQFYFEDINGNKYLVPNELSFSNIFDLLNEKLLNEETQTLVLNKFVNALSNQIGEFLIPILNLEDGYQKNLMKEKILRFDYIDSLNLDDNPSLNQISELQRITKLYMDYFNCEGDRVKLNKLKAEIQDSLMNNPYPLAYYVLGKVNLVLEDYDQALKYFSKVSNFFPKWSSPYKRRIEILVKQERLEESKVILENNLRNLVDDDEYQILNSRIEDKIFHQQKGQKLIDPQLEMSGNYLCWNSNLLKDADILTIIVRSEFDDKILVTDTVNLRVNGPVDKYFFCYSVVLAQNYFGTPVTFSLSAFGEKGSILARGSIMTSSLVDCSEIESISSGIPFKRLCEPEEKETIPKGVKYLRKMMLDPFTQHFAHLRAEASVESRILHETDCSSVFYILDEKISDVFYYVWVDGFKGYISKSALTYEFVK